LSNSDTLIYYRNLQNIAGIKPRNYHNMLSQLLFIHVDTCVTHMSGIRRDFHLEEKTNELVTPNGEYILIRNTDKCG